MGMPWAAVCEGSVNICLKFKGNFTSLCSPGRLKWNLSFRQRYPRSKDGKGGGEGRGERRKKAENIMAYRVTSRGPLRLPFTELQWLGLAQEGWGSWQPQGAATPCYYLEAQRLQHKSFYFKFVFLYYVSLQLRGQGSWEPMETAYVAPRTGVKLRKSREFSQDYPLGAAWHVAKVREEMAWLNSCRT